MIKKEDIVRIFKYLDDYGVPLESKDLDAITAKLNTEVEHVQSHINRRIDSGTPPVRLEPLFKDIAMHTSDHKAFLQTFALPVSDEIRAMVYFITMENADIKELKMEYIRQTSFLLKIKLELESGKNIDFKSDNFWDAEIVRRLGVMMMNGKPLFTGYFSI